MQTTSLDITPKQQKDLQKALSTREGRRWLKKRFNRPRTFAPPLPNCKRHRWRTIDSVRGEYQCRNCNVSINQSREEEAGRQGSNPEYQLDVADGTQESEVADGVSY